MKVKIGDKVKPKDKTLKECFKGEIGIVKIVHENMLTVQFETGIAKYDIKDFNLIKRKKKQNTR